jgi:hypothetical protein
MLSNVETGAVSTQTKGSDVAQPINPLMPAGRTERKKILKYPFIALASMGLMKEASQRIFFLVLLMFTITLSKAQVSDGYLWVAVADSSALPISPTETANPA